MFTIIQLRRLGVTAALFTLSAAAGQTPKAVPASPTQPAFHYDARAEGWITPHGYDMPNVVQRYATDLDTLERYYGGRASAERYDAEDQFAAAWLAILNPIPFEALDLDGRVDYLLLRAGLERGPHDRTNLRKREAEMAALIPFSASIRSLDDELRRFVFIDGQDAASRVAAITTQIAKLTTDINSGQLKASGPAGRRAWRNIQALRKTLKDWFDF